MKPTLLAAAAVVALTAAAPAPAHAWSFRDSWSNFTSTLREMGTIARDVVTGRDVPCGYCGAYENDRDGDGQDDDDENNNGYGGVSWDGGD